jgi:cobalamin-dependent methionine synthase I
MKRTILCIAVAVLVVGTISCNRVPEKELEIAQETMKSVTEETAAKLEKAKSEKEVADILVSHAEKMRGPMLKITEIRKNNSSLDDNETYKNGRARIEVANQKLFAAMNVIGKKYENSDIILEAYGKMSAIIKGESFEK